MKVAVLSDRRFSRVNDRCVWADDAGRMAMLAASLAFILRWPPDEAASMIRPMVWFPVGTSASVTAIRASRGSATFRSAGARSAGGAQRSARPCVDAVSAANVQIEGVH